MVNIELPVGVSLGLSHEQNTTSVVDRTVGPYTKSR